jgi:hypothetical protein
MPRALGSLFKDVVYVLALRSALDTRLPARAVLASGMSLSLFAIVPGFLFARESTIGPISTRSMTAARFPRAPVTKSNPGGAYGEFSDFSFVEFGPSTMAPRAGRDVPTPSEDRSVPDDPTRDHSRLRAVLGRFRQKWASPEASAVFFDIFELWVGPIGVKCVILELPDSIIKPCIRTISCCSIFTMFIILLNAVY